MSLYLNEKSGAPNIRFVLVFITLLILFNNNEFAQSKQDTSSFQMKIADRYGINHFSNISSVQFTFNVKNKDINLKRTWKWNPISGEVQFKGPIDKGKDITISYNHNKLNKNDSVEVNVDKRFINDQYWLLFPFHLVWDDNVNISFEGKKEFPISHKKGNSLIVQYKNNVGYTPNDVFILYLGDDNFIKEWTYRPGGNKDKERSYSWEGNKNFDGITISTEHNGPANKFKVWFSDVKIETKH